MGKPITLSEGEGKKTGPAVQENARRMARSAYLMHQTLLEDPAGEATAVGPEMETGGSEAGSQTPHPQSPQGRASPEIEASLAAAMVDTDPLGGARALSSAGGSSSVGDPAEDENLKRMPWLAGRDLLRELGAKIDVAND